MNTNSRGMVTGPRLQRLLDLERLAPAVSPGLHRRRCGADAIVEQRAIDEARPDVQGVDQLVGEARKPQVP